MSITITGFEAATNADVMNGTRLVTVGIGSIKVEVQAADNVAANHFTASLTLPSGEAPWLDILVPSGDLAGLAGIIDDRVAMQAVYPITKEGHVTLSFTEVGDTELFWRITSLP